MSKKLFGIPTTPDPAPAMPLPDDQAIAAAKKRSIITQMKRSGRESTILSDGLGG